ncbi:hypothetical protein PEX2_060420 [Penicillium expansum]|uniref:Uncharacterized protein n=1 Tax=Penicillium expansum TaxID=27334 RepID=A0A0A2JMC2_PENEN|nr:hypothetical protein PEX2_060420 [Penicillium expansum]KGO53435.1 hypothetical protein PEX2_060420 [Penicillium expansum]
MSPRTRDGDENIPLHSAVKGGHIEVAKLLLECDSTASRAWNKRGEKALHLCSESGNEAMVQLLLDSNPMTTASGCGETALHRAAQNSHAKVCEILMRYDDSHKLGWQLCMIGIKAQIAQKDLCQHTPFVYAVKGGYADIVGLFLRGKWVSSEAKDGFKDILFHEAVRAGQCDIVQVFLDYGAPIDLKGRDGKRALHLAADSRNLEMARLLLGNGASPKIKDSIGNTPRQRSWDSQVTMLIREYEDRAASAGGKIKKVAPVKAAVAAPPEYVA